MGVRRTDGNLMFLYAFYLAALSLGNLMDRGMMSIFNYPLPASVAIYPITFLVTCTICELWSTDDAYKLVMLGVCTKFLGIIMLTLSGLFASPPIIGVAPNIPNTIFVSALHTAGGRWVIGTSLRSWAGSMVSFAIAQALAVYSFSLAYRRHVRKKGSPWGRRWYRYLVGALVGEYTELFLFILFVFAPTWSKMEGAVVEHVLARLFITLCSVIPYYALTWKTRRY